MVMYPKLNSQKEFTNHKEFKWSFKNSNKISKTWVWIPSHPKFKKNNIDHIISVINKFKPNVQI